MSKAAYPQLIGKLLCRHLLELPFEIQEHILDLLLVSKLESKWQYESYRDHLIVGEPIWNDGSASGVRPPSQTFPEVLRTCKYLLQEGLPVLYGRNNFRSWQNDFPVNMGYESFSEEFLNNISNNTAMIKRLWLPGDLTVYSSRGLHSRRKTYTCLERLLDRLPYLGHLQLLVFYVPLFNHAEWSSEEPCCTLTTFDSKYLTTGIVQAHLDLLGIEDDWDRATFYFDDVLAPDEELQEQCFQLKELRKMVNCSMFTAMVLRAVTAFRAKRRDHIFLYEAGDLVNRSLILSRDALPHQYGKSPAQFHIGEASKLQRFSHTTRRGICSTQPVCPFKACDHRRKFRV